MVTYTIIAGVNGVGKSSLTGVLKAERNDLGFIIDTNKIATDYKLSAIEAARKAIDSIDEFLLKRVSFTQETTLSGQRIEKTVKIARERSYYIRLFYIGLDSGEESIKRIKNRVEKGGHNIDAHDVHRRFKKRFTDLIKILPFCDEVHLFDNENGFIEVGEYKNGELLIKGDNDFEWVKDLRNLLIHL